MPSFVNHPLVSGNPMSRDVIQRNCEKVTDRCLRFHEKKLPVGSRSVRRKNIVREPLKLLSVVNFQARMQSKRKWQAGSVQLLYAGFNFFCCGKSDLDVVRHRIIGKHIDFSPHTRSLVSGICMRLPPHPER